MEHTSPDKLAKSQARTEESNGQDPEALTTDEYR
jgi:hypothetical protein